MARYTRPNNWIAPTISSSACHNRIFREDLFGSLEGLVDRLFRRHPLFHDVEHGDAEQMLSIYLGDTRVVDLVNRHRRGKQCQLGVGLAVRGLVPPGPV